MNTHHLVEVALAERSYAIHIGDGLLATSGPLIADQLRQQRTCIITDDNVAHHHLAALQALLDGEGIAHDALILPAGEQTKSFVHLEQVCRRLLALEFERSDTLIALGGGVIGDLAGFAAAILKRGCRFIQIPTTLLAQVDSSVGGKTAIDTAEGKNLIGAFHQPCLVLADTRLLETLPARQMRAGYAEVVKYGLIDSPAFFAWLETNGSAVLEGDPVALAHAVATSCARKAAIVAGDETETTGLRALLNLGHTFGHALEAELGYSDALLHGEAVAIGCVLAFGFSAHVGLCSQADADRVRSHFAQAHLPVHPRQAGISCSAERLVHHMMQDKKRQHGHLPFLLAHGIGQTFLARDIDIASVSAYLASVLDQPPRA